jgi:hypothetical protein
VVKNTKTIKRQRGLNVQDIDKQPTPEQIQLKKNRRVILAIFGIPALVILLSSVMYFLVESKAVDLGTVNNGELITPPLPFSTLPVSRLSSDAVDDPNHETKWAYLVIGDRQCLDSCERMLYLARQSIVALGKKMGRVRLVYLSTDGKISSALQQRFDEEYVGIESLAIDAGQLEQFFSSSKIQPLADRQFFVVDPHGWLMMRYQVENTAQDTLNTLGKAVVKDMKRLIK